MNEEIGVFVKSAVDQPGTLSEASRLCTQCGLCCDGTLFLRARISEGDDPGCYETFGVTSGSKGKAFPLPCKFLQNQICTTYACRPEICGEFECRLLKQFKKGKMSFAEAMRTIVQTTEHAARVRAALEAALNEKDGPLLRLYLRLKKSASLSADNARVFLEFAALQVRLNKYFRKKSELRSNQQDEILPHE